MSWYYSKLSLLFQLVYFKMYALIKDSLMFQLAAFHIYAIIKNSLFQLVAMSIYRKQLLRGVPWNQLKSENTKTLYLLSALKEPVPIYKKARCYGTSMNTNILLTYLLKISLIIFITLIPFYTLWNTSENQRLPDVFRVYRKRPAPWNGLRVIKYSVTYFVTSTSNWRYSI